MKIGFHLPANFAFTGRGNGVRIQAEKQANALEKYGHEIIRLDPWRYTNIHDLDVVQFFQGGFAHFWIENHHEDPIKNLVFAPIMDSHESYWNYSLVEQLGTLPPETYSIPDIFHTQCEAADLIIVRSEYEKRRITDGLKINADKIAVVLNGIEPPDTHVNVPRVRRAFGLPEEFIFHLSSYYDPRKNIHRLIQAVGPTNLPLVIAGPTRDTEELHKIKELASHFDNIRLLSYISEKERNDLMAACKLFALPSMHEGTGLAALEAATYDSSIVITSHGGTKDYFQDYATYCDPHSIESIRNAIITAWDTPYTETLKTHITTRLTWDKSAVTLAKAYKDKLGLK